METRLDIKKCKFCQQEFIPKTKVQKFCCTEHRTENAKLNRVRSPYRDFRCKYCGDTFQANNPRASFCCNDHAVMYNRDQALKSGKQKRAKQAEDYRKKPNLINVRAKDSIRNKLYPLNKLEPSEFKRINLNGSLRRLGIEAPKEYIQIDSIFRKRKYQCTMVSLDILEQGISYYNDKLSDIYHQAYLDARMRYLKYWKKLKEIVDE